MRAPPVIFNTSFRTKVLVPVIGCMVGLVAVTVFVVNRHVTRQFEAQARETLATADAEFRNLLQNRSDDLLLRFRNLPNEPRYRAALQLGDAPTLHQPLVDLLGEQGADIVFYATTSRKVLAAEKSNPAIPTTDFETAASRAMQQALAGQETVDTVCAGGRLYNVVSIPVYVDRELIGALTFGLEIGDAEAQKFSRLTHSQIALLAGGRVIASTLLDADANAQFMNLFANSPSSNGAGDSHGDLKQIILNPQHYFGMAGRFESLSGDKTLGYVLLSSYEQSLRALQATQQVLLGVSLCAVSLGAAVVWLLVSRVTRPLRELHDSVEAVGRGDFTRRVPVRSRDECGELATVFNQMTGNLQSSRAELEKTVETLKTTQAQLIQSEKLSAVGEFVAGVTHELNNPLATVMGFSELLQKADVGEEHRRHLDMVFKSAQRCQKIVQSLLSFARRRQPERKPVFVNALVEAVLEIVSYPLRTGNIEVIKQFAPRLPLVLADAHQIQQVLLNIINNARQAMEAHQPRGQIKIITDVHEPNVRITIRDNGPGIPEKNLRRIFDPFFTTKEVGKGTGLGLSLCYGIIKEHGGSITPLSRPGEGATFIIELPITHDVVASGEPAPAAETNKPNPREGVGRRVLVIDDEEAILQMISEDLHGSGYQVDTALDGESGLRRLRQNHYDATLCDWKMPGLNGRQVYEQLRATNPVLCRRLIFITGDVINEPMRQFLEREQRPCLAKPFTFAEFHATLKAVLANQ
jgi:two-component system, NtrC family, sensor kinase